jgi:hypothetical protein
MFRTVCHAGLPTVQGFVSVILHTLTVLFHQYNIRIIHFSLWALYELGNWQRSLKTHLFI